MPKPDVWEEWRTNAPIKTACSVLEAQPSVTAYGENEFKLFWEMH